MKANSESSQRNVLSSLVLRQQGCINPYRRNLNILKTLICKSNFTFKKVWEKQSKKAIACERSRIYFNNYRESYSRCGPKLEPLLDYVLNCPAHWKIEDALVCQLSSEMPAGVADSDQRRRFRSSLFTVTSSNALTQFDLHQGTVLETIYLSDLHIFRSLQWETEGHIIAVKSTQRAASDVLFAVALFDVYPLRFLAMMEVTKSVFGRRVTGISVSQGLLITMHAAGRVTIYSLQHILEQKKDVGSGDTNDPRLNIQLSEAPPVLFEVKCAGHLMEIGGSPWHCLFSPPRREGTFLLTNLATKKQAENGLLNFNSCNIEPHRAVFHPDESGRIIHIGDSVLRVHRISSTDCNKTCVEEDFTIDVSRSAEENDQDNFLSVTKSGRIVRKRVATDYYSDSLCVNIEEVDYENELDLLCVTSVHHDNDLLGKQSAVYTGFYDNLTGKLLKEIALECSWDSYYEHNVSVDLDTIVQTVKPKLGMFRCLVYRLVRQHAENG